MRVAEERHKAPAVALVTLIRDDSVHLGDAPRFYTPGIQPVPARTSRLVDNWYDKRSARKKIS